MNMQDSSVIIHGSFGSPFENWFSWLHGKLGERGRKCLVPHFPTPEGQTFDNWAAILDAYWEAGVIGPRAHFIAHSSGAVFVAKYLVRRKRRIDRLIAVAGFNEFRSGNQDFDAINAEFFIPSDELRKAAGLVGRRVCFFSGSDPYLPVEKLREFAALLDAESREIDGAGHFNATAGYTSFDEVLLHLTA